MIWWSMARTISDTRYLVADICETLAKPLITAAVGMYDGSITTLKPYEQDETGARNPRYIDLFPRRPSPGAVPACSEAGILGALTGVIGSMMALEVIKEIVGLGEGLVGRLILYDGRSARFETIRYPPPQFIAIPYHLSDTKIDSPTK